MTDLPLHRVEENRAQAHANQARALMRVIGALNNHSLNFDALLRVGLDGVQAGVAAHAGAIFLIDPKTQSLQLAHSNNLSQSLLDHFQTIPAQILPETDLTPFLRAALGARAFILFPLTARGQVNGLAFVLFDQTQIPAPPNIDLIMSIGEQLGMLIENARLHECLRDSEEWHRTFIENSADGIWEGDFTGHIMYVNDAACQIMELPREKLLALRPNDFNVDPAEAEASASELDRVGVLINQSGKIRAGTGAIKTIRYSTRIIRDAQGQPARYQSVLRDVTKEQRVLDTLRHRNQELAVLNEIAKILSYPLEIERALSDVCQQITTIIGLETAVIDLLDESRQALRIVASYGLSEELIRSSQHLGLDDAVTRQVAIEGKVIAVEDLQNYPGEGFAGPRAEGYRAGIAVPIHRRDTPLGILIVGSKTKTTYEPSNVDLLRNIANQIGGALENVELLAQKERRATDLDGLMQLSAACASSLNPQTIYELILEWVEKLLDVDACGIRLIEGDQLKRVAARSRNIPLQFEAPVHLDELRAFLVERPTPLVINDAQAHRNLPPSARQALELHRLRAIVVMPLVAQDRVIGALNVAHIQAHDWSPREIDLLRTIANQAANAIENAQLFQAVLRERQKVQAIFDSGLSGLYVTDAAGNLVMLNRAAMRITGWSQPETLDKSWDAIFAPRDADPAQSVISKARATRDTVYIPDGRKIRTRTGAEIPVAEAAAPLFDEKENLTGVVGAFWDLSLEKQAELTRENLLTIFVHQLRSPLTSIISGIELLARPKLARGRRALTWAVVKSESARLNRFAHQFLDKEGAFASAHAVECTAVPIDQVIETTVQRLSADARGHQFRIKLARPTPRVWADLDRVEHILSNLLDNAIHYSPPGTRVTISVKPRETEWVEISVQDQGPGISIEEQDLVFQKFYRAKNQVQQRVYGHGLGLAIVREMVTALGGKIWVERGEPHGAIFRFTLRRVP